MGHNILDTLPGLVTLGVLLAATPRVDKLFPLSHKLVAVSFATSQLFFWSLLLVVVCLYKLQKTRSQYQQLLPSLVPSWRHWLG
eukprot:3169669-Lingulodinium_polyedra.AAC.1